MKRRLQVPRTLAVVVITGTLAAGASVSCGKDDECIRCLPAPQVGDAGIDAEPVQCPACLPMDGVCPAGCIPEGYV